jgi:hypothetical protein
MLGQPELFSKIEVPTGHLAAVVSRQAGSANIGPQGVDCACGRDAHVPHKGRAAIAAASHASVIAIDIFRWDSSEIGIAFQRKARPLR